MKYANQLNLVIALIGIGALVYAFSVTFFAPADSAVIDPARLRSLAAQAASSDPGGAVLQQDATTPASAVDQALQRREASEQGGRPGSGLAMPGGSQGRLAAPTAVTPPAPGATGPRPGMARPAQGPAPQRPASRSVPVGRRSLPVESGSGQEDPSSGGSSMGIVGVGGGNRATAPAPPPRGVTQPRPGAEVEKRDQPTQPAPPPFRSSMPARRPPQ